MDKRERSDIAITLWEIIKKKRRNPLGKWDLRGLADFILTDYGDFSEIVSDWTVSAEAFNEKIVRIMKISKIS